MNRKRFVKLLGPVEDVLRSEAKKREEETLAATGVRARPRPSAGSRPVSLLPSFLWRRRPHTRISS